jgi:transposase-like protein
MKEKKKFKKALSAMPDDEFDGKFPDEKAAIDHFLDIRYKGNLTCPRCGAAVSIYRERKRLKVFHCISCENTFSPFAGTIFEKTHIKIRKWFKAIRNFLNDRSGYSACRLERDFKVTYKTAWRMLQQIRIAAANRETEQIFEAAVEIDETYAGGKPGKSSAILDKEGNVIKAAEYKNKRGRGTKKTPVAGIKERSSGHVYAKVMLPDKDGKRLSGNQLISPIEEMCRKGTTVMTDEYKGYRILESEENKKKYIHLTVNHSPGQFVSDSIHTNGIENFRSVLKRGIKGVYIHVSVKYLQRYIDEFCCRQNTRLEKNMFNMLLGQCVLV